MHTASAAIKAQTQASSGKRAGTHHGRASASSSSSSSSFSFVFLLSSFFFLFSFWSSAANFASTLWLQRRRLTGACRRAARAAMAWQRLPARRHARARPCHAPCDPPCLLAAHLPLPSSEQQRWTARIWQPCGGGMARGTPWRACTGQCGRPPVAQHAVCLPRSSRGLPVRGVAATSPAGPTLTGPQSWPHS